ncbi:MAG: efflux RND transporter periplasmic adaptor subunit [Christensenellales bacterium]
MKRIIFLIGMVLLLIAVLAYGLWPAGETSVETVGAIRQDFVKTVETDGVIAAAQTQLVTVPFSGVVRDIFVQQGQRVGRGEKLFEMVVSSIEEELEQARMQLASMAGTGVVAVDGTALQQTRTQVLANAQFGSASYESFNRALGEESASASAVENIELKAAQLKVEKLERQLDRSSVFCERDGEILSISIQEGTVAQGDTAAILLGVGSGIVANAQVGERDLKHIQVGQSASIVCEAISSESYAGTVTEKAQAVQRSVGDAAEALGLVSITPGNMQAMIGATAEISIEYLRLSDVLVLPMECLAENREDGDLNYVFVVESGRAVRREVRIGEMDGFNMVIEEGLDETDRVILRPVDITEEETVRDDGGGSEPI